MTLVKVTVVLGVVVLGVLCWLAASGVTALAEVLITLAALVVMIGGGNWLSGRTSPYGMASRATPAGSPAAEATADGEGDASNRYCPGADLSVRRPEPPASGAGS